MIKNNTIATISLYSRYRVVSFFCGKITLISKNPLTESYDEKKIIHELNILLGDNLINKISFIAT